MIALSFRAWAAMLVAVTALIPINALVLAFVLADVWDNPKMSWDNSRDGLG